MGFYFVLTILVLIASFIGQSSAKHIYKQEGEVIDIRCPRSDGINIDSAVWVCNEYMDGDPSPHIKEYGRYPGQLLRSCYWSQSEAVKSFCETKEKCSFTPTKALFGDLGYTMMMRITFHCSSYDSFDGI